MSLEINPLPGFIQRHSSHHNREIEEEIIILAPCEGLFLPPNLMTINSLYSLYSLPVMKLITFYHYYHYYYYYLQRREKA